MVQVIQELRHLLTLPLPGRQVQYSMAPDIKVDFQTCMPLQKAGVLILLFPSQDIIKTVFIKRTEYEGHHSGQISLPGGKSEPDDKDIICTALRETKEEIGIDPMDIEILGLLTPLEIPVSSFEVHPVVGFTKYTPNFEPDRTEVEFVIETDIRTLINPLQRQKKIMNIRDFEIEVPYFDFYGNHIWGATAMMLAEFIEVVRRTGVYED